MRKEGKYLSSMLWGNKHYTPFSLICVSETLIELKHVVCKQISNQVEYIKLSKHKPRSGYMVDSNYFKKFKLVEIFLH